MFKKIFQTRTPSAITVFLLNLLVGYILHTDKKENEIFIIYIRTFRWDQLQCHTVYEEGLSNIWGNAETFNQIWGGRQSYMTLQLLYSEFPYILEKNLFSFYQCTVTQSFAYFLKSILHQSTTKFRYIWRKVSAIILSLSVINEFIGNAYLHRKT